ncbi:chromodomain-helicase-DNA-binding protein 6 [Fistulifera solaris]|uniref:Chromodomain-helicase-DNA-binding protein 6 n=1 Tax=Fistulifera solaris TaxID=1519565 RepID=A0A1Z5JC49_FISSO|nr:chromodomain-helicase-DNA-binding protein 6 [Fistulifera solaris]|eukprot:GAX11583.1 chromodomain-helicase-DNA-binding protein 6 [Fistulifera solaris]
MNPDESKSSDLMSAIPRKRLPPPNLDMPIPRRPSASAAIDAPIPRHPLTSTFSRPQQMNHPSRSTVSLEAPIPRRPSSSFDNAPQSRAAEVVRPESHVSNDPVVRRTSTSSSVVEEEPRKPPKRIRVKSEHPLILVIQTKGLNLSEGFPRSDSPFLSIEAESRSRSARTNSVRTTNQKRPRSIYLEDTDSEEEQAMMELLPPKKPKETSLDPTMEGSSVSATVVPALDSATDAPPPGTPSTLWYSNESFLHVWVLDKVCGFKVRRKTTLKAPEPTILFEHSDALALQARALQSKSIWTDPAKRMELSRINPTHCPVLQALKAAQDPSNWTYEVMDEKEEVLLIKWRGRSHLHCSWERADDVIRLDSSNNSTARNKIRRYYQQQESNMGLNWKSIMRADHQSSTTTLIHGQFLEPAEEYFGGDCLEIERILACDENEMDMSVLAKQRTANLIEEQEALHKKESEAIKVSEETLYQHLVKDVDLENDIPWDPEDNVRYVVKWKGMPFAEMTWEYWRDIKRDAVDEAEDFWYRQKPPSDYRELPHPHIREFRKVQESADYGISSRPRLLMNNDGTILKSADDEEEVNSKGFRLRGYQLEGVNWLLFNWWNKRSCILADEMGLGKTIQSAAFLRELQTQSATQVRAPFLIVAPLSLVGQWQSELMSWAPDLNVLLYHGSADAREFLVEQEFYFTDQFIPRPDAIKLKKQHVTKFHVLITTYEVILKDVQVISKIKWKALIVDEAHRLKNSKSRLFEQLANVPRDFCLLLTGTPIANATEELWALLNFANPGVFSDKESFLEKFGEMTDAEQVNELHSLLKPYLLRRVKEDVEKSLPPKEETILEVSLTPIQKTFYKAIYERNTSFLFRGAKPSNAPSLMNVMMELRKCCNHPYLIKGAEDRILAEAAAKLKSAAGTDGEPAIVDYSRLFGEQLIKSSGKMVLMEKLLQKLFDGGHKVLIFSQMVRVLDLLEELLRIKKYRYERLDGSTSSSSRTHAVDRFTKKSFQRFVMLLSTRAGGLGLNLTAADVVIIFDSDWNPQNDLQAMARAHRIGQTRAVRVYRLLTAKTYEMHMFHSASLKLGLERAVMSQSREQSEEGEDKLKKKSDKEAQAKQIDELLKKGAYDVFRDEDDTEAEKFMETDIDQLLEHSSKVTYGASATSSLGSGLGSFSKASFVANTDDGTKDVDLDDPEFWSKAVGLEVQEETPDEIAQMLDDGVKRSRKQVQVYDPHADTAEAERRKKDMMALEKLLEKEEKERLRHEQKVKKQEAKERKRRNKKKQENINSEKQQETQSKPALPIKRLPLGITKEVKDKEVIEPKPKKSKKNERMQALKRAENANPVLERLKQAWEAPQRNRAIAATIRYGFARFCKLRSESNLCGLPLQDLESFLRAFIYQVGLQVAVALRFHSRASAPSNLRLLLKEWLGFSSAQEINWICDAVRTALQTQLEVESLERELRLPLILTDPTFVLEIRQGAALRSLRRIGILSRLNRFINNCLDSILGTLGHEALGKRGCSSSDLATLDADLKARFVTTEELSLIVGTCYKGLNLKAPATWWDRDCDISLLVGSFIHGLGNYEAMRNDFELPFLERIARVSQYDAASIDAAETFRTASSAAVVVFDDALEAARIKAELEVQAAVAAAAKAASKREEDAALLRKGGAEAEAVISEMPDTQVEDAFAFDGTDSHFVTLPRLIKRMHDAVKEQPALVVKEHTVFSGGRVPVESRLVGDLSPDEVDGSRNDNGEEEERLLSMPDARILDFRLRCILDAVEMEAHSDSFYPQEWDEPSSEPLWSTSPDIMTLISVHKHAITEFAPELTEIAPEFSGIGIGSNQCGSSHRTLNDGSDYGYGPASVNLSQVAYGTDAPRYLRALGIPMNLTRYAITGLVHARDSCAAELLAGESLRYYGTEDARSASRITTGEVELKGEGKRTQSAGSQLDTDIEKARKFEGFDPINRIPSDFLSNAELRATICVAVLFLGFPSKSDEVKISPAFLEDLSRDSGIAFENGALSAFSQESFRQQIVTALPSCTVPDTTQLAFYVEKFLLPHCLRLCVNGNGGSTRNARGSHGDYATAFGVSVHPEPSKLQPSPLPDPCVSLENHSLQSVGYANAILRRVQLLRSSIYVCSERSEVVKDLTRSESMGYLKGMPMWWCPWVHDTALLVQVASGGLFSILKHRTEHPIFNPKTIEDFVLAKLNKTSITGVRVPVQNTDPQKAAAWTKKHSNEFPSLFQLERRLAHLCSKATIGGHDDYRYDSVPMFDHGAWPR